MSRVRSLMLSTACLLGGVALAAPPPPAAPTPAAPSCALAPQEALAAANAWRQEARRCGGQAFDAARSLRWNLALERSAERFATELAARGELSHQGESSPTLRERVRESGYLLRAVGENLAAGPLGLDEVFALWTASEDHCRNLMRADFEEMGLACVSGTGRYERYWVLHLGAPARRY